MTLLYEDSTCSLLTSLQHKYFFLIKLVKLFCAIVGAVRSAFPVDIDSPARDLQLFLAMKYDAWLRLTDSLCPDEEGHPRTGGGTEHTSVKRQTTRDDDLQPRKRVKTGLIEVIHRGPVPVGFYSVPVETIDTLSRITDESIAPLCLLYGPHGFGKTTIALRLREKITVDPSVLVIYLSLNPTEKSFWLAFSRTIREKVASFEEFQEMLQHRGRRLWVAIDEMDAMLENEELHVTSNFMNYLWVW
ncbi:Replication factor C subunit 5 [Phytophthora citrophthora]|uniref:Replication factor C subunit 5 n=1 Tax=Phytophthora citrophthora TaxID=4793 RepID=A0AAD9GWD3_9STRA|nr:Replication factor C subunit 5 [Phytophthora citrophthora]